MIVDTSPAELRDVARCHRAAFPDSLSTALGIRFVMRMLSWYLSSEKTFLFHMVGDQVACVGYCGGMIKDGELQTGSSSGMAQHSFSAALRAVLTHPWVLFHPGLRKQWPVLWNNLMVKLHLRQPARVSAEEQTARSQRPQAGLVVIGVDPAFQGRGVGSRLLDEFERRAVETYGVHALQLSVKSDNIQAIRAYEKNGWVRSEQQGTSLTMVKHVS